jgi:hypothetical protein
MKSPVITTMSLPKRRWLAHTMAAALLAVSAFAVTPQAQASLYVSVGIAPPLLPIYEQPPIPGPGYIWTPGYWAYDDFYGYYWVPGTWVRAPYIGALWTPGYWGWNDTAYVFYPGYWGDTVGYYGDIDYGYGYTGIGYYGGYWDHGGFYYNTAVNRIGTVPIATVYSKPVVITTVSRVSFNGPTGVRQQPTAAELANSRGRHIAPVSAQVQQQTMASHNASLRASVNHGKPPILATPRAGMFASTNASVRQSATVNANAANRHQSARIGASAEERTSVGASARMTRRNQSFVRTNEARVHAMTATRQTHEPRSSVRTQDRVFVESRPVVQHREPAAREFTQSTHARANVSYGPSPNRMQQVQRQERRPEMPAMTMHSDMSQRANGAVRMDNGASAPQGDQGRPPSGGRTRERKHGNGGG